MKQLAFVVVGVIFFIQAQAQQAILFTHQQSQKEVMIQEGDLVKLIYKGYLGQMEEKEGYVSIIRDTLIELTVISSRRNAGVVFWSIDIKNIIGFRKFARGKPYLKMLSNLVITAGSIYLFYSIDQYTNLNFGQKLGLSLGAGLVSAGSIRLLFPERVKNWVSEDGWKPQLLK